VRVLLAAAGLVAAVVTALALHGTTPGGPGGANPGRGASTPPASHAPSTAPPSTGGPAATGAATAISFGVRVPAQGVISLGVGEVRHYLLHLTAARDVSVTGYACSDLVPWQLIHTDGGQAAATGDLSCRTTGPYHLSAGDYELRVGGRGVDGKYALKLDDR
jgi:hypothetical protein